MSDKKIKILTLSDHPLSPSGVGTQTNYMIQALLATGKYTFVSFGGAMKHENYSAVKTEEWQDDWIIYPVDCYGSQDSVRSMIRQHKPDILWFMTDPRFWGWLWQIEDEIRPHVPMVYYHVWDNYPYPKFNRAHYKGCDAIASISKVTHDIVENVVPEVDSAYIPHAVDPNIFKKIEDQDIVNKFRMEHFGPDADKKLVFFWNNRNARRKQSGTLLFWFKAFLDKVGHDKASLVLHTDPKDPHGQDLEYIIKGLDLHHGQVKISNQKVPPQHLSLMYNAVDCTINISDAEGFGLATLESLSCETPIIVNMTGGLQEQVTDGEEWFGIGIEPVSKAIIGSQESPWIYEDRLNEEVFVNALEEFYNMSPEKRLELGQKGRQHTLKNYNFENFGKQWDDFMTKIYNEKGSWSNRKNYSSWELKEL